MNKCHDPSSLGDVDFQVMLLGVGLTILAFHDLEPCPMGSLQLKSHSPPGLNVKHQQSPAETQKAQDGESVPSTGAALNISQMKASAEWCVGGGEGSSLQPLFHVSFRG